MEIFLSLSLSLSVYLSVFVIIIEQYSIIMLRKMFQVTLPQFIFISFSFFEAYTVHFVYIMSIIFN